MSSVPPNINRDLVPNGSYGSWLHPFVQIASNGMNASRSQAPDEPEPEPEPQPMPARRGRGRPRVSTARDASAIEKRRAQVRNAQRAYQERKDDALAIERKKREAILGVLSELSMEVEELLNVTSDTRTLDQKDVMRAQLHRLRDAHDEAINSPSVKVELRQLRSKKPGRRTTHSGYGNPLAIVAATEEVMPAGLAESSKAPTNYTSTVDLELGRVSDSTLISPYSHMRVHPQSKSKVMGGRSIFEVVADRQAAMRNAENPPS